MGANCRRIRVDADVTQNKLALHARDVGLRWTASKVGDFESGRAATVPLQTALLVSVALTLATGRNVSLADLVQADGFVVLSDALVVRGPKLVDVMNGADWDLRAKDTGQKLEPGVLKEMFAQFADDSDRYPWLADMTLKDVSAVKDRSGLDEARLAKRLEVSSFILAAASARLWNASVSDERDQRAGVGANAQHRGRISRELAKELKELLDGNR